VSKDSFSYEDQPFGTLLIIWKEMIRLMQCSEKGDVKVEKE